MGKKVKTYVLIVSQVFPTYHKRAGEPTDFERKILEGEKIHTLRENYLLWRGRVREVQNGNAVISIRVWTGSPYRSNQREIKRLTQADEVHIREVCFFGTLGKRLVLFNSGLGLGVDRIPMSEISKNDGLSITDFEEWFKRSNLKTIKGLIHFNNFRYNEDKRD